MTYDYGRFVWFELLTSDKEASKRFYTEVLGWTVKDMDMGQGMKYAMVHAGESGIAGFADLPDGAPPHWVSYLSVPDVDKAAKAVKAAGGATVSAAFDVPNVGRMMPVTDPQGARLFLFHNANGDSPAVTGAGSFHWNELSSPEPEAAVAFYQKAFGHAHEVTQMPAGPYFILKNGPSMRGGAMKQMMAGPAAWLQYVAVDDCDAAVKRADKNGGEVAVPAMDVPGVGRFAILSDPHGALFGVIKPAAG